MPAGDVVFHDEERRDIDAAITAAERVSGRTFSVFVGPAGDDPRAFACRHHAALADPDESVLVMVDQDARALEIVTGRAVSRVLSDPAAALTALGMQSRFAAGDLTGGIVHGLQQLAQHARAPRMLHAGP